MNRVAAKIASVIDPASAYLIKIPNKVDKIGQATKAFSRMTANLKTILATKADLEKEIKERKKAEEKLRQSENMLKKTQKIAMLGSWEYEIASGYRHWSDETYHIYGYEPQSFIPTQKDFIDIVHPEDQKMADDAYFDSLKANKNGYAIEYRILKKSTGELRIIYEKCEHIRNNAGKIIRSIGMIQDITESKNLDQRKDEFITIAGHELRTPVSAVRMINQILQELLKDNLKAMRYLEKIDEQSSIQADLINDLLDVSKIQTGKLEIRKEQFDLQSLVEEIREIMQRSTQNHKIIIRGNICKKIFADKERIEEVLVNFCTNAIKFSPNGGEIVITLKPDKNNVIVKVTDHGIGIPKENRSRIFEKFYRVYGGGNKTYPGLGMGLYISYQIIKAHNGNMGFKSTLGKGSTFYFLLPFEVKSELII